MLKALRPTVVGIRNLSLGPIRNVVEEGPDYGTPASAESSDCPVVLLVHGQHVVEPFAVVESNLTRSLGAEVKTPDPRVTLRSLVRR